MDRLANAVDCLPPARLAPLEQDKAAAALKDRQQVGDHPSEPGLTGKRLAGNAGTQMDFQHSAFLGGRPPGHEERGGGRFRAAARIITLRPCPRLAAAEHVAEGSLAARLALFRLIRQVGKVDLGGQAQTLAVRAPDRRAKSRRRLNQLGEQLLMENRLGKVLLRPLGQSIDPRVECGRRLGRKPVSWW